MTTRLNGFVKMTNLPVNFLFLIKARLINFRILRMRWASITLARRNHFLKFDQLFANWFFVFKKWANSFQNRQKHRIGYAPNHLIPFISSSRSFVKIELSTKTLRNPKKWWRFCVRALQLSPVKRISFANVPVSDNAEAAFSIDKPSKISKIFSGRSNCVSTSLTKSLYRIRDQVTFMLVRMHQFYQILPIIKDIVATKSEKKITFHFLFDKIWMNIFQVFIAFFRKHKMIRWSSVFLTRCFRIYTPFKMGIKPFDVLNICRDNRKSILVERGSFNLPNKEAAIPINITGSVGKISRFIHTTNVVECVV